MNSELKIKVFFCVSQACLSELTLNVMGDSHMIWQ